MCSPDWGFALQHGRGFMLAPHMHKPHPCMSTLTTNPPKHCALAASVSVQARSQTHPTADGRAVAIVVAMAARFVRRRDTQEATADNTSTHDTTNDGRAADAATSSAASTELCGDGKCRLRLCRSSCAKRSKRTRPSQ